MKTGIYITGLGQSFSRESVDKYAARLMNQISYSKTGTSYRLGLETIKYSESHESDVVSIIEITDGNEKVIYKLYDFKYHKLLTEKFESYSLIIKNLFLIGLVLSKSPLLVKRVFASNNFNYPIQTLYIFGLFFIIAFSILFMLPASIGIFTDLLKNNQTIISAIDNLKSIFHTTNIPLLSFSDLDSISKASIFITSSLLIFMPGAKNIVSSLATEFMCANNYLKYGAQRQLIQGNLESLVEYISEHEGECKIHYHTYSFGSIIALDYLFPIGTNLTNNNLKLSELLITIGTPVEFINAYYPKYFSNRKFDMDERIEWINIYSILDALASNFRKDSKIDESEFGLLPNTMKPVNLNYEISSTENSSLWNYILLSSIHAHGSYWDSEAIGQSCINLLYREMSTKSYI